MGLKNRLKYWRHHKMMNQKEFAEFLGVNYYQYSRWENNIVQPDLNNLWRIKEKLGCTIEDIIEGTPE